MENNHGLVSDHNTLAVVYEVHLRYPVGYEEKLKQDLGIIGLPYFQKKGKEVKKHLYSILEDMKDQ